VEEKLYMLPAFSKMPGKARTALFVVAAAVLLAVPVWLIAPRGQADPGSASHLSAGVMDLGFTYLTVTPQVSDYYGLGIDSGALITDVAPGSAADLAGLRPGDIVVSFNGVALDGGVSLLTMLLGCGESQGVTLEVCEQAGVRPVRLSMPGSQ